ncbi:MAG: beta-glucosidase BglX [Tannerellaceae bacterium]|nr:beta-glucosidase BglX [Tannerellaceae bacterium]
MSKRIYVLLFILLCLCRFLPARAQEDIETRVEGILSTLTLRQKIGQMNQLNARKPDEKLYQQIRDGEVGSILNAEDPVLLNRLQQIAMEECNARVPLLFARDVIHGFKTIFPIPLGQAASFNPEIVEKGARVAALETSEKGIRWTFAPMMDISRDARWGRIAESFGEDTYLSGVMGMAMVRGFQGDDLADPTSIAACAKHFVAYGAVEGGRDYNVSYIPERQLRKTYLPPFERSIREAGCATLMTSFNSNDGIPPSANRFLLRDLLRDEWGFDGVVVSDWASVSMMIRQGFCEDRKDAARKSALAGLDMDMTSECFVDYLEELVREGDVPESVIDQAVRNILRLKFRLGLFSNPYTDLSKVSCMYAPAHLEAARQAAAESFVLLKNTGNLLPLSRDIRSVAVIGPLADAPHDQLGTWCFDGEKEMTRTPLQAIREQYGDQVTIHYAPGLAFSREQSVTGFDAAIEAAQQAEVILLFIGEESILSGEAHCLAGLDLVGAQAELVDAMKATGKPLVTIIMAGRPLTMGKQLAQSDALLYAWHPGTMGGPALAGMLWGETAPSGKLPVTFPAHVGQIPLYYNQERIGRPANRKELLLDQIPQEARQSSLGNTSYYLDAGFDPLFVFGYGLSYTTFTYSGLTLSREELSPEETLKVSVTLVNTGSREGTEVVQLYISDLYASVATPEKELKDFCRVTLKPGESRMVEFELPVENLSLWNIDMQRVIEPGKFDLMIGGNSRDVLKASFRVK